MARPFVEPVDLAPFLAWVERRLGEYEAAAARTSPPGGATKAATGRLLGDLGWATPAGQRRLWRYRHGWQRTGQAERALIEDALDHAGVGWWEVYGLLDAERARA